jgi:hypothetical protein
MSRKLKGEEQFSTEALVLDESMTGNMRSMHPLPTQKPKNRILFLSNAFENGAWESNRTEQKSELDSHCEGVVRVASGDRMICGEGSTAVFCHMLWNNYDTCGLKIENPI